MKTIAASEFKAKCLSLFKSMKSTRESYTITVRGKPIAEVTPVAAASRKVVLGAMRGESRVLGDIVSPQFSSDWFDKRDPIRSACRARKKK